MAAAALILSPEELEQLLERAAERGAERALARGGAGDVLSTAAAARIADRDVKTVREWCVSGALPAQRRGRTWAIRRADLDAYLSGDPSPSRAGSIMRSLTPAAE